MDKPEERRHFPRAKISLQIQVGTGTAWIPGKMQNLTIEGVAFIIDRELPVGSTIEVEINAEGHKIRKNVVKVEVLRCEPQANQTSLSFLISGKLIDTNDIYISDVLALIFGQAT